MAINYTTLFTNVGEFVQRINDFTALYAVLDTDLSEIEGDLISGREDVYSGLPEVFSGFKSQVNGWVGEMIFRSTSLITHREDVIDELALGGITSVQGVLVEIYRVMVDDSQDINASVITIGSISEDKANASAGSALVNNVLDGYNRPGINQIENREYNGIISQLADNDTMTLTCISDSETDGATEGQELFQWTGKPRQSGGLYHWEDFGSGSGPNVTVLNGAGIVTNGEFENFTTNTPDSWTIDTGSAGATIFEDTDSADVHRGGSSLRFLGNASLPAHQISQTISANVLTPRRRYCLCAWVKGNAAATAGTLTIQFEGTDYTATSSERIQMNSGDLAAQTSYGIETFYINIPDEIPTDFELVIKWTGTPSAHDIHIDGLVFGPVNYFNGVNAVLYAGASKFLRGDRFTFTTVNNDDGTFQKFFRKAYGVQMPSQIGGTETQADTLAE